MKRALAQRLRRLAHRLDPPAAMTFYTGSGNQASNTTVSWTDHRWGR